MICYLDSSPVTRVVASQSPVLRDWGAWERAFTSDLTSAEVRRSLHRIEHDGFIGADDLASRLNGLALLERRWTSMPISRLVLRLAGMSLASPLKTLDAIHIASAIILRDQLREPIIFATHDRQQATAARSLGFEAIGV